MKLFSPLQRFYEERRTRESLAYALDTIRYEEGEVFGRAVDELVALVSNDTLKMALDVSDRSPAEFHLIGMAYYIKGATILMQNLARHSNLAPGTIQNPVSFLIGNYMERPGVAPCVYRAAEYLVQNMAGCGKPPDEKRTPEELFALSALGLFYIRKSTRFRPGEDYGYARQGREMLEVACRSLGDMTIQTFPSSIGQHPLAAPESHQERTGQPVIAYTGRHVP